MESLIAEIQEMRSHMDDVEKIIETVNRASITNNRKETQEEDGHVEPEFEVSTLFQARRVV